MYELLNKMLSYMKLPNVSRETSERFEIYAARLEEKNEKMNLTSVTGREQIAVRHFGDSLALMKYGAVSNGKIIDVGCGAGFPGLPIKIYGEQHTEFGIKELTLLDATGKKIEYLDELTAELGVKNVQCVQARAEEYANQPDEREKYGWAVSRAVATVSILSELCLPFVAVGGRMLTLKSYNGIAEAAAANKGIKTLGSAEPEITAYRVLPDAPEFYIISINKNGLTPQKYPRAFGKIKKNPL